MRYVCFTPLAQDRMTYFIKFSHEKRRTRMPPPPFHGSGQTAPIRAVTATAQTPPMHVQASQCNQTDPPFRSTESHALLSRKKNARGNESPKNDEPRGWGKTAVLSAARPLQQKNRETGEMFPRCMTAAQCLSASARVRTGSSVRKVRSRYRKRPSTMVCTTFSRVA